MVKEKMKKYNFGISKLKSKRNFEEIILREIMSSDEQTDIKNNQIIKVLLFNYCKIDTQYVKFITDTTIIKQDKLTPGMHIPIYNYEYFSRNLTDYCFLLAWGLKEEIFEGTSILGVSIVEYNDTIQLS